MQTLGGSIGYIVYFTRPDASATLYAIMRYVVVADAALYTELLWLLFYLVSTAHYTIEYSQKRCTSLRSFMAEHSSEGLDLLSGFSLFYIADASGGPRPMQCAIGFAFGGPFDWRMTKGATAAMSVCEREWFGQTLAAVMACSYDPVLVFMGDPTPRPYLLLCDSSSAILLSEKDYTSRNLRHVGTRLEFLQDKRGSGLVLIIYMKEHGMIANIGTKVGIDADSFHRHRIQLVQ